MEAIYNLPINKNPYVIGGLHHAHYLSIILAYKESECWFFSQYINLCFNPANYKNHEHLLDFANPSPSDSLFLEITKLDSTILTINKKELISKVLNWLEAGYYVYIAVDERKIKGTQGFISSNPLGHFQLIYGVDIGKKIFMTVNFDSNRQYNIIPVSFENLTEAFIDEDTKNILWDNAKDFLIQLVKYKNLYSLEKDKYINYVIKQLEKYIQSLNNREEYIYNYIGKNTHNQFFENFNNSVFGIDIYDEIIRYIQFCYKEPNYLDYRCFHFLYEHKKVMLKRIDFFKTNYLLNCTNEYILKYDKIVKDTLILRNMILKIYISKKFTIKTLSILIEKLKVIRLIETELLKQLVCMLNEQLKKY